MVFLNALNPLKALHSAELLGDRGVGVSSGVGIRTVSLPFCQDIDRQRFLWKSLGWVFAALGTERSQFCNRGFQDSTISFNIFRELHFAMLPLHLQTFPTQEILAARKLQCKKNLSTKRAQLKQDENGCPGLVMTLSKSERPPLRALAKALSPQWPYEVQKKEQTRNDRAIGLCCNHFFIALKHQRAS